MNKGILQRYPGSALVVRDTGWHKDHVKLLAFANDNAVKLYKEAIAEAGELWTGEDLVAVHRDETPSRPRA